MGTARLNVWVTSVGDACRIDTAHQWYIHVLHCEGDILQWGDTTYMNLAARDSHLEIEVPPGCYMVCATWSPAATGDLTPTSLGNHITHVAVVRADCDEHVCVTLFPPTFHHCGVWWTVALEAQMETGLIDREVGMPALEAARRLLEAVPADPLTERMLVLREIPRER